MARRGSRDGGGPSIGTPSRGVRDVSGPLITPTQEPKIGGRHSRSRVRIPAPILVTGLLSLSPVVHLLQWSRCTSFNRLPSLIAPAAMTHVVRTLPRNQGYREDVDPTFRILYGSSSPAPDRLAPTDSPV